MPLSQLVLYWGKDVDPKYYGREPETYPDAKGLLNAPFKVFTVKYDQKRVDALLQKAREIWAAIDAGELPPRDHKHTPSRKAWARIVLQMEMVLAPTTWGVTLRRAELKKCRQQ